MKKLALQSLLFASYYSEFANAEKLAGIKNKKKGATKIVCVGDSITRGLSTSDPKTMAWPAQLDRMLNNHEKYEVVNLGLDGRYAQKKGCLPLWTDPEYQTALQSEADIIIMGLGTNDARYGWWHEDLYHKDYIEMAHSFLNMKSKPKLYLTIPPPLYLEEQAYNMQYSILNKRLPELIPQMAKELGLPDDHVIDQFTELGGASLSQWELFCDGQNCDVVHPNDAGNAAMAKRVFSQLFMPPKPTARHMDARLLATVQREKASGLHQHKKSKGNFLQEKSEFGNDFESKE